MPLYSPKVCPGYWDVLNEFGKEGIIGIPQAIHDEILKVEDDLSKWLSGSTIPVLGVDEEVMANLKKMYGAHPNHEYIVSNNGIHSAGDPWLIAHVMKENAVIVTKESNEPYKNPTRIKIPHICDNMGIRWMDDFAMVQELNFKFSCSR